MRKNIQIPHLVDRVDPQWGAYYAATDLKHFGNRNQPGSKFVDPKLKRVEDILILAYNQRGNLQGTDEQKFINLGASPEAFNEGYRYLYVETPGTLGIVHTSTLPDNELVQIIRTKPGAPCSVVATVASQTTVNYGVVILTEDEHTGLPRLITTFPGMVTKTSRVEELEKYENQTVPLSIIRPLYGEDFWVNTRIL